MVEIIMFSSVWKMVLYHSNIHVMDARLGEFVYPSKDDNKSGANWIIRPFANI